MTPEQFDEYRREYRNGISNQSIIKWHSKLYADYPEQTHFNKEVACLFFDTFAGGSVVEVGGWRGEMADTILPNEEIVSWDNYEVCAEAAADPVCTDKRYCSHHKRVTVAPTCDTLILSHVIEHLTDVEARLLLETTDAEVVYVDAPLSDAGVTWDGETCFHVLEMGWPDLDRLFAIQGYECSGVFGTVRWYER